MILTEEQIRERVRAIKSTLTGCNHTIALFEELVDSHLEMLKNDVMLNSVMEEAAVGLMSIRASSNNSYLTTAAFKRIIRICENERRRV